MKKDRKRKQNILTLSLYFLLPPTQTHLFFFISLGTKIRKIGKTQKEKGSYNMQNEKVILIQEKRN